MTFSFRRRYREKTAPSAEGGRRSGSRSPPPAPAGASKETRPLGFFSFSAVGLFLSSLKRLAGNAQGKRQQLRTTVQIHRLSDERKQSLVLGQNELAVIRQWDVETRRRRRGKANLWRGFETWWLSRTRSFPPYLHLFYRSRFYTCVLSQIFSHNKVLTPTKSYCYVELLGLNKHSGCFTQCTRLCQKLVLLPPSAPARSIPLLSTLADFPVPADPGRAFELPGHQSVLGLPPHVICLSRCHTATLHPAKRIQAVQIRARAACEQPDPTPSSPSLLPCALLLLTDPRTPTARVCFTPHY